MANLNDEDQQMVLMALAHLAVERPGWKWTLERIALLLGDDEVVDMVPPYDRKPRLFTSFRRLHKLEILGVDEKPKRVIRRTS
jgi:hypothetical protein